MAATVAALLAVGGGGFWYATGGDAQDDRRPTAGSTASAPAAAPSGPAASGLDPAAADRVNTARKPDEAKLLYLRKNVVDVPHLGADVFGPWQVDDTVVIAMYRTVTAYSAADGRERWSLPLGSDLCSASPRMTADRRIVAVTKDGSGKKGECRRLRAIDLTTGRPAWEQKIVKENRTDVGETFSLAFAGGTVAVGRPGASSGYRMSDGKRLFGSPLLTGCVPYGFAGGPKLIAAASCPAADGVAREEVRELDPATGKTRWRYPLPRGSRVQSVFSVAPLVVAVSNDAGETTGVFALSDDGARRSTVGGAAAFFLSCREAAKTDLANCRAVVDSDTLYMATRPAPDGSKGNEIVAVDLATGKTARRISLPMKAIATPLGMSGHDLLIDASPLAGGPDAVATVAPGTTEPRVLMRAPMERVRQEGGRLFAPTPLYTDGRYVLVNGRVSGFDDDEEREMAITLAFGT
ncbi:PQQ-binding-like beta-propeller repeat protein [Streptomyces sp. NPDC049837]|uniref:outer membrane protein assembly factor BamB family protein n=1 Tax=Streptomyces sp. NPDC049837 TaxID=3155277 RepID=UPI00342C8B16